jgi:predicted metal-binding protein
MNPEPEPTATPSQQNGSVVDVQSGTVLHRLLDTARALGATDARIISAAAIPVEPHLALLCQETRCPGYGQSMSCPPNVAGPAAFQRWQKEARHAMVIRIEVPMEYLLGGERIEIMQLLHHIVSGVEQAARAGGYPKARGFAGDSCKKLFCALHPECRVLDEGGPCRNPDLARPSMSGFGINVGGLMEAAGWRLNRIAEQGDTGTVTGLVLLG